MKRDKHYKQHQEYAEKLMQQNAQLVSPEQADFLQTFSSYRHFLHSFVHQYFFHTKKSVEIDNFFAVVQSKAYFEKLDLPYPTEFFALFSQLKLNRDMQFENFEKSVEQFAFYNEALNSAMERYLQKIDDQFNTHYCPSGSLRDTKEDPVKLTIDKLHTAQERISPFQKRIQQELDKMNEKDKQQDIDI